MFEMSIMGRGVKITNISLQNTSYNAIFLVTSNSHGLL